MHNVSSGHACHHNPPRPEYRLPLDVLPQKYSVDLDVSPNRETFSGSVDIEATSKQPLTSFELNARDLKLGQQARVESGGQVYTAEIVANPEEERAELNCVSCSAPTIC